MEELVLKMELQMKYRFEWYRREISNSDVRSSSHFALGSFKRETRKDGVPKKGN